MFPNTNMGIKPTATHFSTKNVKDDLVHWLKYVPQELQ